MRNSQVKNEKKEKEIKDIKESQRWANDKIENLEGKRKKAANRKRHS